MSNSSLFSIVAYVGDGANAADIEVIESNGVADWPRNGYNLRRVIYWTSIEAATEMLGIMRISAPADSIVRVSRHDADADYITRNDPPIRIEVGR